MSIFCYFSFTALLGLAACKKEPAPTFQEIFFEIPLTMRPAQATMALGDTLWLEANYSDSLLDIRSGQRYRLRPQDAKPFTFISFLELTGQPQRQRNFASAFEVINYVGRIDNLQQTAGRFEPTYQDGRYRIKIGLRAIKAGIANIVFNFSSEPGNSFERGSNLSFLDLSKDTNGRKIIPVLRDIYYVINEGKANNFHLLEQHSKTFSMDPGAPEATVYDEQKRVVC